MNYSDDWLTIYGGDCREVLATLPDESVHCVVTSPPYWGLRDYGAEGQLGLEPTPEQYVENMVAVFREVRRVLRDDGTLWLNLGDSYAGSGKGGNPEGSPWSGFVGSAGRENAAKAAPPIIPIGLKPKDLVGIPWRVAFALQADGWYLRSDIIWAKPNPMPESVTDRPTKSHEYLFLLAKSQRYYFDADAVREGRTDSNLSRHEAIERHGTTDGIPTGAAKLPESPYHAHKGARRGLHGVGTTFVADPAGRNIRSVWTIPTQPYPGAHFAVFPPKLIEPCIKAGSSERGVCPECGAPWMRVTESTTHFEGGSGKAGRTAEDANANGKWAGKQYGTNIKLGPVVDVRTLGWKPSCDCRHPTDIYPEGALADLNPGADLLLATMRPEPVPAVILDPFAGSGTTGMVAQSLSRRAILIDLNPDYIKQQMKRNQDIPLGLSA